MYTITKKKMKVQLFYRENSAIMLRLNSLREDTKKADIAEQAKQNKHLEHRNFARVKLKRSSSWLQVSREKHLLFSTVRSDCKMFTWRYSQAFICFPFSSTEFQTPVCVFNFFLCHSNILEMKKCISICIRKRCNIKTRINVAVRRNKAHQTMFSGFSSEIADLQIETSTMVGSQRHGAAAAGEK